MKVWLVISSYRNDLEVAALLDRVKSFNPTLFDRILIVDSMGTGCIPRLLERGVWEHASYRSYDSNLGSGANLCERLRLAEEGGADYAFAVNHDGNVDSSVVSALLEVARSNPSLGAAYPLSLMVNTGLYNMTGIRQLPLPARLVSSPPPAPLTDVFWSSSNGALYSLNPVRQGIVPWPAMWMGWEDLEYGWRLHDHGYRQVIVSSAIYRDNHEYVRTCVGNTVDKPAWRTYYCFRNLLFAIRRSRNRPSYYVAAAYKIFLETGMILFFRNNKWRRLRELVAGVGAGLYQSLDETIEGWGNGSPSLRPSAPGLDHLDRQPSAESH